MIATENNLEDPKFVNFDVNGVGLTEYVYNDGWDFHVEDGSPVLAGTYPGSDIVPYFAGGLTVNGKSYQSPAIADYFGAYGTK